MGITDTDKELIAEAKKVGMLISTKNHILTYLFELRALINHYIAKDRAQGREPYGWFKENVTTGIVEEVFTHIRPPEEGAFPLYTHAQPIAEIQAEALQRKTPEGAG